MRSILSFFMVALVAVPVFAADELSDIRFTAEAYFKNVRESKWGEAAGLMHPEALESFKRMFGELADSGGIEFIKQVFLVNTREDFRAADPKVLFSRLMIYLVKNSPGYGEAVAGSSYQIRGVAHENGSNDAYVVYLLVIKVKGMVVEKLTVIPMRKGSKTWGVMLTGEMKNMAEALKKRYAD